MKWHAIVIDVGLIRDQVMIVHFVVEEYTDPFDNLGFIFIFVLYFGLFLHLNWSHLLDFSSHQLSLLTLHALTEFRYSFKLPLV